MPKGNLSARDRAGIEEAVEHFVANRHLFETFAQALMVYLQNNRDLYKYIHFMKHRVKDPDHLRGKLERKYLESKQLGQSVTIDASNLFEQITDLAGVRIIHLHTEQMREIHKF